MKDGDKRSGNTSKIIADATLKALKPGQTATDSLPGRGNGSIYFDCKPSGAIAAFYRYVLDGKRHKVALGHYKAKARDAGLTLAELRAEAQRLAKIAAKHGDVAAYLAEQQAIADAERAERQRQVEVEARKGSFAELMEAYAADLERHGKVSYKKVRQLFKSHVADHHPELVKRKAADIQPEDIQLILAGVLQRQPKGRGIKNKAKAEAGNGMKTTADELRRYLKAAFNHAAKAHLSPERIVEDGKLFAITSNPVALIPAISGTKGGNTESLTPAELAELLRYLDKQPERYAAIAKAFLYFGGQRLRQLVGVPWDGVADDVLVLLDAKGRKESAWEHLLPITTRLKEIMSTLLQNRLGPGPFSLDAQTAIHPDTLSKLFTAAGRELAKEGKARFPFTWRHLRATCETLLAAQRVPEEVRAWLLSHGRQGIQKTHYDRYAYLPEKHAALEQWGRYLDSLSSGEQTDNVVLLLRRG